MMMTKLSHPILLPKTRACVKRYAGQAKWMYFLIENDGLLEKYNNIWDKVRANFKKELDSVFVNDKNFLKTKIKSDCDEGLQIFMIKKFLR